MRGSPARRGLTSAEAAARLDRDGLNAIAGQRGVPLWRRLVAQLRDPLVVVLLAAAVLTLVTGDLTDAAVILLVIVANTAVSVSQEVRADQAIAALSQLAAPHARVVRDGVELEVPAAELVVGDLLVLAEGDIVPADARLVATAALLVDESPSPASRCRSTRRRPRPITWRPTASCPPARSSSAAADKRR
jgi:Ca2+-transporting ATPase